MKERGWTELKGSQSHGEKEGRFQERVHHHILG